MALKRQPPTEDAGSILLATSVSHRSWAAKVQLSEKETTQASVQSFPGAS